MIVTMRRLKDLGACPDGIKRFRKEFGSKAKVTRRRLIMFKDHVTWASENLFPEHWEAYRRVVTPHWEACEMGMAPDREAFHEACANVLADLLGLP